MSTAQQRRACPAVQREISSAECGENRVSRYACPPTCAFNVLTPDRYDEFIQLEREVIQKAADWHIETAADRAAALRTIERVLDGTPEEQHALEILTLHFERDARGRTLAERWEAANFPGLKNDGRVIFRAMMHPRLRLVEVRRVLDDLRTEVVDLFEPGAAPFVMHDRSLAARACRFTAFIGWLYELPHLVRVSGLITVVQEVGLFEPLEVVREIIRHLGGPAEAAEIPEWFARHAVRFQRANMATALARREAMFRSTDMEFGKAVYELRAPFAECRARLDEVGEVATDDLNEEERDEGFADARAWFDKAVPPVLASLETRAALGRVLLGQSHWRLEALGAARLARLRTLFEAHLGERVRFSGERRDDMAAQFQAKGPDYDAALVPPRLLEHPELIQLATSRISLPNSPGSAADYMATFREQQDRAWLDNPVPALNGHTPRAAAQDPALRPTLIRLLKLRVHSVDARNLEEGTRHDITWLLRELGAHEIMFDPPPPRTPLQPAGEAGHGGPPDSFRDAPDLALAPPLPKEPFTLDESVGRMMIAMEEYETVEEAMLAMEQAGGFLVGDAKEIVGDLLNAPEFTMLAAYLTQLWFALVPPGCWGPAIEYEDFHAAYGRQLQMLVPGAGDKMEIAFEKSVQPALLHAFAVQIIRDVESAPSGFHVRDENRTLFLLVLNAALEQLDAALRDLAYPASDALISPESDDTNMPPRTKPTPSTSPTYAPPLAQLLTRGQPRSKELSGDEYAQLGITHADVPELIRMSLDEALNEAATKSSWVWAPVHAWRALAELRAGEAVVPLLGLLRRIDEAQDDWVGEQMPRVLGHIGSAALGPVAAYLADAAHGDWARVAAGQSLRWIATKHPELRGECVAVLTRQLEKFADQSDTMNAFLVSPLLDLRAVESLPVMERAFAAGLVDESVCGDYEDMEIELGLKQQRDRPRKPNKLAELGMKLRAVAQSHAKLDAIMSNPDILSPALPLRAAAKVGRNDPCPCGSGKKYKKCCGV